MPTPDAPHSTHPIPPPWVRLLRFCAVGFSGVGVNAGIFWLFSTHILRSFADDPRVLLSSSIAVAISIQTNFFLNDAWTWADRRKPGRAAFFKRLGKYTLVASGSGIIQVAVTWLLSSPLQINSFLQPIFSSTLPPSILDLLGSKPGDHVANLCGIAAGIAINFFVNNLWTFRSSEHPEDNTTDTPHTPLPSNPKPPGLSTQ